MTSIMIVISPAALATHNKQAYKDDYKHEATEKAVKPSLLKDGFYVGAGIGIDLFRARQNFVSTATAGGVTAEIFRENPDLMVRGMKGDLLVGYDHYFMDKYYLGAEFFGNESGARTNRTMTVVTSLTYNAKISVKESYGASLLGGYKTDPQTLMYARVGYTRTRLMDQEQFTLLNTPLMNLSSSQWTNGVTVGLGIERAIYGNFSIRGEYDYSLFSNINNTFTVASSAIGSVTTHTQIVPVDNHLMLDFIYHIA
jgi:opacity protein-like surface antigen